MDTIQNHLFGVPLLVPFWGLQGPVIVHKTSFMRYSLGALDNFMYFCFLKDGEMEGLKKKGHVFLSVPADLAGSLGKDEGKSFM